MTRLWKIKDRESGVDVCLSIGWTAHDAYTGVRPSLPKSFNLYEFVEIPPESANRSITRKARRKRRAA